MQPISNSTNRMLLLWNVVVEWPLHHHLHALFFVLLHLINILRRMLLMHQRAAKSSASHILLLLDTRAVLLLMLLRRWKTKGMNLGRRSANYGSAMGLWAPIIVPGRSAFGDLSNTAASSSSVHLV